MKRLKLSIIVPIYNLEKYIEKCIESILGQTFTEFELIIIDDGSSDNSKKLIDRFASRDSRIKVIYQENHGVSFARNAGLRIATGEYVSFVDGDDFLHPQMYEKMLSVAEGVEIVCCNICTVSEQGEYSNHLVSGVNEMLLGDEFAVHIFDIPRTLMGANWNKLYRRDLITDNFCEGYHYCEDNLFLIQYCRSVKRAYFINEPLYYVLERSNSAMREKPSNLVYSLPVRREIIKIAKQISEKTEAVAIRDYLDNCYGFLGNLEKYDIEKYHMVKIEFNSFMKEYLFKILFNSYIDGKLKILYCITFLKMVIRGV